MPDIERLLHRVPSAQQRDASTSRGADRGDRGVGDVQNGNRQCCLHRVRYPMHGVGADQDAVGAGIFEAAGGFRQHRRELVPSAGPLARHDFLEVEAAQLQPGRSQAAEASADFTVDDLVVQGGRFPAHAANEADRLHDGVPQAANRCRASAGAVPTALAATPATVQ
jgi:hypothetical protein